ncbi:MAG: hypothetical protein ABR506_00545 [Candidatus Krumholzibacteriia bacterium]
MGKRATCALLAVAALAAAAAGCNDEERDQAADVARLEAKEAEIDALIGDAACAGGADCRAVAFGAKPCGGPWQYKVYAAAKVDTVELLRLIEDYNATNARLNETWGWASDCAFVSEPAVDCVEGRCRAVVP